MAGCAYGWNIDGNVVRVGRLVVIRHVTTVACIRGVGVISLVTGKAIARYGCVSAGQRVYGAVIKCGGTPCGLRMTGFAGSRELGCNVIGICSLIVLLCMTAITNIGCIIVIPFVAAVTIISDLYMSSLDDKIIVMDRECSRFPVWQGSMAGRTFLWNIDRIVIWIGRLVKIRCMAIITNRGSSGESCNMTLAAFDRCMSSGEGKS